MVRPTGIEPVTPSLEGWCSIRLSYGRVLSQSNGHKLNPGIPVAPVDINKWSG